MQQCSSLFRPTLCYLEQMIEVYRSPKGAGGYREKQQLRRGEVLTALNIPEFSLPVENVLG
jgi:hypothetical protein